MILKKQLYKFTISELELNIQSSQNHLSTTVKICV